MKRPNYIRDSEERRHALLLEIADAIRLGNHAAAAALTKVELDAMTDFVIGTTGENRAQIAQQAPVYVATRYSLARRCDGSVMTIHQPISSARAAENMARDAMVAASRSASRPARHRERAPASHTDHAPPANPRELERRARAAMQHDAASAWRKGRQ